MDELEKLCGPVYGVRLIESLPLGRSNMTQAMPSRRDLQDVRKVSERTVAGYEVLLNEYRKAEEQRDAWRAACRFLYEIIGEGGAKGRPLDLIQKGEWGQVIALIGKAESLESR